MSTILLVDGQNFKELAREVLVKEGVLGEKERPNWCLFDFAGLFAQVLQGLQVDFKYFYLSEIIEYPETRERSRLLIREQRDLLNHLRKQGFQPIIAGKVRGRPEDRCGKTLLVFREKGVDVRIAVDMITMTLFDKMTRNLILASSDSDLQPAIREIRKRGETYPAHLIYLGFESKPNKGLSYTTHRTITIRNSEVVAFYKKQLKILNKQ